jgi:hypothetical protein
MHHHQQITPHEELMASLEEMHEAVAQHVPDAQRAARLNSAVDGLGTELISFQKLLETAEADAKKLSARPDATRPEFESLLERFDTRRKAIRARLIDWHFQMIDASTPEEWKKLAPHERAALNAAEH